MGLLAQVGSYISEQPYTCGHADRIGACLYKATRGFLNTLFLFSIIDIVAGLSKPEYYVLTLNMASDVDMPPFSPSQRQNIGNITTLGKSYAGEYWVFRDLTSLLCYDWLVPRPLEVTWVVTELPRTGYSGYTECFFR